MAYNEEIENRVNKIVSRWKYTGAKKMFGGVCHLLSGNMFCGVLNDDLILRLGEKNAESALKLKHVKPMDITGKPMKGWVMVARQGFPKDSQLRDWLQQAKAFVKTLPPK